MKQPMSHARSARGLSTGEASKIAKMLQDRLATLVDLDLALKHARWSVRPGVFATLEVVDQQAATISALANKIAERIATLGGLPEAISRRSSLNVKPARRGVRRKRAVALDRFSELDRRYHLAIAGHESALKEVSVVDSTTAQLLKEQIRSLGEQQSLIRRHVDSVSNKLASVDPAQGPDSQELAVPAGRRQS
ncbi:MAG: hypothetical protein KJO97_08965 [Acidimicrobiia bacterium]|nr:hypothetical protein [Acidimicrobiia bacterium]